MGKRASPKARIDRKTEILEGRSIALRRHFTTFIGLVADVRVNTRTGVVEPVRLGCAHDVGLIVNPETLKHVIERQLVYGAGRTTVDNERVTSVDWASYPVRHMEHAPKEIVVHLIERPTEALSGAAEMALGLVPAAMDNAIFDATGVRIRKVPFAPNRVLAELKKSMGLRVRRRENGQPGQRSAELGCLPGTIRTCGLHLRRAAPSIDSAMVIL